MLTRGTLQSAALAISQETGTSDVQYVLGSYNEGSELDPSDM